MSDWYSSESILPSDDIEHPDEHLTDSALPLREGLPLTYAMRHDRQMVVVSLPPAGYRVTLTIPF